MVDIWRKQKKISSTLHFSPVFVQWSNLDQKCLLKAIKKIFEKILFLHSSGSFGPGAASFKIISKKHWFWRKQATTSKIALFVTLEHLCLLNSLNSTSRCLLLYYILLHTFGYYTLSKYKSQKNELLILLPLLYFNFQGLEMTSSCFCWSIFRLPYQMNSILVFNLGSKKSS